MKCTPAGSCSLAERAVTSTSLVVNDTTLLADFARSGLGLAYLPDVATDADLVSGRLLRVLAPYVPTTTGLFLYFPVHTQSQPKLRAFIDTALSMP